MEKKLLLIIISLFFSCGSRNDEAAIRNIVSPENSNYALKNISIIAHRGYWNYNGGVQNTLLAFSKAQELEVHATELDVRMSKDGVIFLHHDDSINGVKIQNTDSSILDNMYISVFEKLPRLEDYLKIYNVTNSPKLFIDIKSTTDNQYNALFVANLVDLLNEYNMPKQTKLAVNDFAIFNYLSDSNSEFGNAIILGGGNTYYNLMKKFKVRDVAVSYDAFETYHSEYIKLKELNIKIHIFTINDINMIIEYDKKNEVDGIVTDIPDVAMALFK